MAIRSHIWALVAVGPLDRKQVSPYSTTERISSYATCSGHLAGNQSCVHSSVCLWTARFLLAISASWAALSPTTGN